MSSLSDFIRGLDDAVWTNTRAGNLDNLNTTVSSRATQTSVDTIDTNVDTINSRVDTTVSSRATQTSVDTIDANVDTINSRVDTTVSSRAPSSTALSNATWTNARAGNLDNLNTTVSSRATQTSVDTIDANVDTINSRVSTINSRVDTTVSSRAPSSTALSNATWTNTRAGRLDNLNTTVSSRAPASTALSNSVWTNTRAGYLDAPISSAATPAATNSIVYTETGATTSTSFTDLLNISGSGYILQIVHVKSDSFSEPNGTAFRVYIDGVLVINQSVGSFSSSSNYFLYYPPSARSGTTDDYRNLFQTSYGLARFNSSLQIQGRRTSTNGAASAVVTYQLD